MEGQDQIRVATALSELGREVLGVGGAEVVFALDQDDGAVFVATLPPRACVNELVISPTWNRLVQGGLETPKN